jgi:hypothetical protein
VEIERSATQQHYRSIVGKISPGLRSLIRSLGGSNSEHAARLEAFALGRGVALHP